jgi:hypothetical protein
MKKNVGKTDRTIRLILAVAVFPMLFVLDGPARFLGLAFLPLLGTALTRRCGAYALIGTSTCERES